MKTTLVLFGQHIDIAARARRRKLIVLFYGIFGALLLWSWTMGSHTGGGFITIEFTLLVGPLLGGYFAGVSALFGRAGLVEPFSGKKSLKYPDSATILEPSTLLHPIEDDDPELRTDERAVRRRNYAHYVSHGFLSAIVGFAFILEFVSNSPLQDDFFTLGLSPSGVNHVVYGLLQIGYIASMTLPQAILLWTEPDIER